MKRLSTQTRLLLVVTGLLGGATLHATEFFVNKQGLDSNAGTSREAAFLTIQKGVDALQPGDTLTIGRGEYVETVARKGLGAAEKQTTIRAEIPGTVLLRGDVDAPVFTPLPPEETAKRVGENYTPEDVGIKCELYRLDVARECKELGIPYVPTISYGFWRKNARYVKKLGKFMADQLAATETKEDKAQKRAEKKALKIAFTLDYPDERLVDLDSKAVADTQWSVQAEERRTALPANNTPKTQVESDGDQLWA